MEGNIIVMGVVVFACLASIGAMYYRVVERIDKGTLFIFLEAPGKSCFPLLLLLQ